MRIVSRWVIIKSCYTWTSWGCRCNSYRDTPWQWWRHCWWQWWYPFLFNNADEINYRFKYVGMNEWINTYIYVVEIFLEKHFIKDIKDNRTSRTNNTTTVNYGQKLCYTKYNFCFCRNVSLLLFCVLTINCLVHLSSAIYLNKAGLVSWMNRIIPVLRYRREMANCSNVIIRTMYKYKLWSWLTGKKKVSRYVYYCFHLQNIFICTHAKARKLNSVFLLKIVLV